MVIKYKTSKIFLSQKATVTTDDDDDRDRDGDVTVTVTVKWCGATSGVEMLKDEL